MLNRSKTWAGVFLIVAFASGAVVGGAASSAWAEHTARNRHQGWADRLQPELGLTTAQHDSVEAIVHTYQPQFHAVWEAARPRIDSIRVQVRARVSALLTPDQRVKFHELNARSDSTRRAKDSADSHAR